jgi:hypothetical protein
MPRVWWNLLPGSGQGPSTARMSFAPTTQRLYLCASARTAHTLSLGASRSDCFGPPLELPRTDVSQTCGNTQPGVSDDAVAPPPCGYVICMPEPRTGPTTDMKKADAANGEPDALEGEDTHPTGGKQAQENRRTSLRP